MFQEISLKENLFHSPFDIISFQLIKLIIECYSFQWSEAPFTNIEKIDSNPSIVSNHMPSKVWYEIT